MRSYEVRQAHLMPADAAAYRPFFFHTRDFVLRNGEVPSTYTLLVHVDGEVFVRCHIALLTHEAVSLPKASFGGFDLHPDCTVEDLVYAIEALKNFCAEKHLPHIRIISYPECYDSFSTQIIHEALIQCGASVLYTDLSQYVIIGRDTFDELIDPDERRHLNFARKQRWSFWQESSDMLADAFDLIVNSREAKGYPVTMTFEELSRAFSQFPDRYMLFSMRDELGKMVSVSVCIHVNEEVLYDFYHGDDLEWRKHSPVVPLISGLYNYARTHGYSLMDLGTSTEEGRKNKNLFKFKKHLGAVTAEKKIYSLSINN